jgi:DNA-binding FrmR family transcriptional regulator
MKENHKRNILGRLKTVRGHMDAVIQMVEEERYCPQVLKQVSALQASLERCNRILLQNHLETCVPRAIADGRSEQIVDELMESLKYTAAVTGPAHSLPEEVET